MRKLYILELAAALWLCMAGSVSAEILHMGMRGAAVESLQNDLVEAGYLARTVDGDYGSTTVKAVSEFQKDHGLPVTGKADDSTQAKLKEDDGKGYRDGGGIVYAQGNRGDMIAELQDRLAAAGYLTGASDGIYGEDTAAAVEQFQKDHRLPVSGAVDEQTLSLLGGVETGEAKKENKKEIKKEQKNKKDMHYTKGDRGSEIKTLQNKLRRAGYLDGEADGIYGNDTESAVRALQEEHGLSVTGNVDDATWKLLGGLSAPSAGDTLKAGDRGKRVVKLQNRLLLHGYNPGGSDGIYGAATAEAVRKLQAEEKLDFFRAEFFTVQRTNHCFEWEKWRREDQLGHGADGTLETELWRNPNRGETPCGRKAPQSRMVQLQRYGHAIFYKQRHGRTAALFRLRSGTAGAGQNIAEKAGLVCVQGHTPSRSFRRAETAALHRLRHFVGSWYSYLR